METAHSDGRDGDVVSRVGEGPSRRSRETGVVFQRSLSVAGHVDLRAHHWIVVLVHRPVYRATRPGRSQRNHCPARQHLRLVP